MALLWKSKEIIPRLSVVGVRIPDVEASVSEQSAPNSPRRKVGKRNVWIQNVYAASGRDSEAFITNF